MRQKLTLSTRPPQAGAIIPAWRQSIYAGRDERGVVTPCTDGKWLAEDNDGHRLGEFAQKAFAIRAVLEAARAGR